MTLPAEVRAGAERYGIHPALLDASLHVLFTAERAGEQVLLPFSWSGVRVFDVRATSVRVRLARTGEDAYSLSLVDPAGAPVASIETLVARPVSVEALNVGPDGLYRLDWLPAPTGDAAPQAEQLWVEPGGDVSTVLHETLAALRSAAGPLTVVTRGATTGEDLAGAAVWGLVRSAQTEQPDRFTLVDLDGSPRSERTLPTLPADEPQLAVRDGAITVPRLTRATSSGSGARLFDPSGTVLITGGTGALSAALARHLITEHGARHLVLTSRRGPQAPGAEDLADDLRQLGAAVEIVACDAADRPALESLLAGIPSLAAVIHAAGVVDDGTVESLTPEKLDRVLRPKVDAARHLNDLVPDVDLFVLFSSATSILGTAGQANYAAANAYLDALATARRATGRAAVSLSWGLWANDSTMTSHLSELDLARINRGGVRAHTVEEGLALFDAACRADEAHLVPIKLDPTALRTATDVAPPLRSFLKPRRAGTRSATVPLAEQLAGRPEDEQRELLLELVRANVAAVLAHGGQEVIPAEQAFKQLGFDSLTAVELRNRLNAATGLKLPATLTFDYPTPQALVEHLLSELGGSQATLRLRTLVDGLAKLETALDALEPKDAGKTDVAATLQRLLTKWRDKAAETSDQDDLESITADDLFDLLDDELGDVA
ncbi:type I polyketide synthase [Actinophytocola sp.]|uniref:type I polyketide synthase n=1 Tax=Actinophytocola sp. TaxID=1872138 RepID=UPI00389B3477